MTYLLLFSFYRPCLLKYQGNKSVNPQSGDLRLISHNFTKVPVFSRASLSPEGQGDRWPEANGTVAGRGEGRSPGVCSKCPCLLGGFQQGRRFQKGSNRGVLDVKTLTDPRSSHPLLYSFLPRCYCEKLAVKFNWFRIFWIHMAANPGAEAAIAPHCCSRAFASPPVPRWRE